jgi:hypothetical protein
MKRIGIVYAGAQFSVGQEDFEQLKADIEEAARSGRSAWIRVNHGEGRPQHAELLIGPGIPIALIPISGELPSSEEEAEEPSGQTSSVQS